MLELNILINQMNDEINEIERLNCDACSLRDYEKRDEAEWRLQGIAGELFEYIDDITDMDDKKTILYILKENRSSSEDNTRLDAYCDKYLNQTR